MLREQIAMLQAELAAIQMQGQANPAAGNAFGNQPGGNAIPAGTTSTVQDAPPFGFGNGTGTTEYVPTVTGFTPLYAHGEHGRELRHDENKVRFEERRREEERLRDEVKAREEKRLREEEKISQNGYNEHDRRVEHVTMTEENRRREEERLREEEKLRQNGFNGHDRRVEHVTMNEQEMLKQHQRLNEFTHSRVEDVPHIVGPSRTQTSPPRSVVQANPAPRTMQVHPSAPPPRAAAPSTPLLRPVR